MGEKQRVVEAIKHRMRVRGVTYAQMAEDLGVSESTAKRYFSQGRFTLDTLDRICAVLGATLDELLAELDAHCELGKGALSLEQEQLLADNDALFALYYLIGGGWTFSEIVEHYAVSRAELTKLLSQLDRAGLIDYRSDDDLRHLVPIDAAWNRAGPLWAKHKQAAVQEFFASDFTAVDEQLQVAFGPVFPETAAVIRRKMARLHEEILGLIALERIPPELVPSSDRYWFVSAMRPMSFSALSKRAVESGLAKAKAGRGRGSL